MSFSFQSGATPVKERIKVAVIGVGYLGSQHARIYSELANADLVGVIDIDQDRAENIAQKTNTRAFTDISALIGRVQAVSVVTPTCEHLRISRYFLNAGIDVLVEKPMALNVSEADEMISLAEMNGCILQVGHLERFNGAVQEMFKRVNGPKFIECNRLAPFTRRSTDVDVVLDLMIHDIDIILELAQSDISSVQAVGVPVLTKWVDIANARIEFASGCIANVTSSRISMKGERKIRLFQSSNTYLTLDYGLQELRVYRKGGRNDSAGFPRISGGKIKVKKVEPLRCELESFLAAVSAGKEPVVTGIHGREALKVAEWVKREIAARV